MTHDGGPPGDRCRWIRSARVAPTTAHSLLHALLGPPGIGFRRFWLAGAISVFGTWMAAIALAIRMFDETGSPGWVAALLFAEFVPMIVIGIFLGDWLNRLPVQRTMVLCDLAGAAVFGVLSFVDDPPVVVALAGVAGLAMAVFGPLATTAVPLLVPDEEIERATGAMGSADNAMTFLGEVAGGIIVGVAGATVALGLNSASFLVSAVLLATCTALARPVAEDAEARPDGWHIRRTVERIAQSPTLRQIAVGWTFATVMLGGILAVTVPLLRGSYDTEPAVVGLLMGSIAIGLVAGSLFAGRRRFGRVAYPLALAGIGASAMIAGASPAVALGGVGLFLLGVFNGIAIVLNRSRAVRAANPAERAGLIGFLIALSGIGQALGTVLGGLLATTTSPRWAFVVFGLLLLVVAAPLALVIGPRAEWALNPSPWADRPGSEQ
jgi:MFS family permease